MSPRGTFLVFEGIDVSGKSTQARRVAELHDALFTFEPGDTELGVDLRRWLLDAETPMDPATQHEVVFDDPDGGTIRRVPVAGGPRKVELIVPDLPDATEFTLHGPEAHGERRKASVVLDRRAMGDLRDRAQGKPGTGGSTTKTGGAR